MFERPPPEETLTLTCAHQLPHPVSQPLLVQLVAPRQLQLVPADSIWIKFCVCCMRPAAATQAAQSVLPHTILCAKPEVGCKLHLVLWQLL
jgi:hypothetical protein